MASQQGSAGGEGAPRWEQLSDELKQVLAWAAATERHDVGTRAMLIGMLRSSDSSDLGVVLTAIGCSTETLFEALQRIAPRPAIDPWVSRPSRLRHVPPLSPNGKRALAGAAAIRDELHPREPIRSEHVLAAILALDQSTGYRGLANVAGGRESLRRLGEAYRRYYLPVYRDASLLEVLRRTELTLSHGEAILDVAFAPDGHELATAGGVVRLWDVRTGAERPGHDDARSAVAVAYAPDGIGLALGGGTGQMVIRSRDTGELVSEQPWGWTAPVTALAFRSDGSLASANGDGSISLWRPALGKLDRRRLSDGSALRGLAMSPEGDVLACAGDTGVIWIVDLKTFDVAKESNPVRSPITGLAFSPDGERIAYAAGDGTVGIWNVRAGEYQPRPSGPKRHRTATDVAFSPDGALLASVGEEGLLVLRDGRSGASTAVLTTQSTALLAVAFSPTDHELIATGGAGGIALLHRVPARGRSAADRTEWLADGPAEQDALNREALSRALATRLDRADQASEARDESFLIHVDGPWGTGKSSVLTFLERQLDEQRWTTVRFDAWRQSRVGPPWWALLTSLRKTIREGQTRRGRLRLRASETVERVLRDGASHLLSVGILAVAVVVLFVVSPSPTALGQLATTISAGVAAVSGVWVLGRVVSRFLMWDSATAARLYERSHEDPMECLAEHFAWLLSKAQGRVIFFVDDLDRCEAGYVVNLLDSIQTLVRDAPQRAHCDSPAPQPYFVVAADGRWIRQSYDSRHQDFSGAVGEPGRSLGYLFLDKMFQLTVRIPAISAGQRDSFLKGLLLPAEAIAPNGAKSPPDDELARRFEAIEESEDQGAVLRQMNAASAADRNKLAGAALDKMHEPTIMEATEHELQRFTSLLEPNPRSMKRFVNAYSMAASTALLEGRRVDSDLLARWTILSLRWPDLADRLRREPDEVTALTGKSSSDALDAAGLSRLVATADVRRLATFGGAPLTPDAVREICGDGDTPSA